MGPARTALRPSPARALRCSHSCGSTGCSGRWWRRTVPLMARAPQLQAAAGRPLLYIDWIPQEVGYNGGIGWEVLPSLISREAGRFAQRVCRQRETRYKPIAYIHRWRRQRNLYYSFSARLGFGATSCCCY